MTDSRRLLAAETETAVLPYLGGPFVDADEHRLKAVGATAPGYWRFEISGREARAIEQTDPPDLGDLPAVRGFWVAGYLVGERAVAYRLSLWPAHEPRRFTPVTARRWPCGALLYDGEGPETGVEDRVRAVFDAGTARGVPVAASNGNGAGAAALAGVPAALRAAFGYAVMLRVSTVMQVPVRPIELRGHVGELVAMGDAAAERILDAAQQRRQAEPNHVERWRAARTDARLRPATSREQVIDRAAAVLHGAGAVLRDCRWLSGDLLEVRYDFLDDRFVSVVDGETLRVVDTGICRTGHDKRLTLSGLPGVIAEAVRTYRLKITAW
jgi:hypothetical protein